MKLLSLYYTHKPGGLCARLYRLMNALCAQGHSVIYLCLDDPGERIARAVTFERIPFPISSRSGKLFWALFICWCPLFILVKSMQRRPDGFFVFGAFYATMCLPSKLLLKKRVVLFIRSLVFRINALTGRSRVEQSLSTVIDIVGMRSADRIVVMSKTMKEDVEDLLCGKNSSITVVPNDLQEPIGYADSPTKVEVETIFVAAGVLDKRKNIETLVEAFNILQAKHTKTPCRLLIAGDGPELANLKRIAGDGCEFVGWKESLAPIWQRASLLIHPSHHEGMPNVVLEALANGVPILLSDIPEHRELARHSALLFPVTSPTDLADRLEEFLMNSLKREEIKSLSIKVADDFRFDWDKVAAEQVIL